MTYRPCNKVRFFGDSWYWSWLNTAKSKTFNSYYDAQINVNEHRGLPNLESYFNFFNIDCVQHNHPGSTFLETTDCIINIKENDDIKYNIVFVSSVIRRDTFLKIKHYPYDKILNYINKSTIEALNKIEFWANQYNQHVIFIGGQTTIHKNFFEQAQYKNLHLLSECIISTLIGRCKPYGIFKLADFAGLMDETTDKEFIHQVYEDLTEFAEGDIDNSIKHGVQYPDYAHLNAAGGMLLVDEILYFIEKIEAQHSMTN